MEASEQTKESPNPRRKYRVNLHNVEGVKRMMAQVTREMRKGKMDRDDYRALIYGLSKLAEVIRVADIETRLLALNQ